MSLYRHCVLPRLIDLAMTGDEVTRLRAAHVPGASGVVLEVGIGSGLNLPFYTSAVTQLYGVDSSPELLAMARRRKKIAPFPVELFLGNAERLPLAGALVDTVVVTWSLCSIRNVAEALREMRRVLKHGGRLMFVEHGLSPDENVSKWQNRLTPLWRVFAGGCHLNRRMDVLVRDAGFELGSLRAEYVPGPRMLAFMYQGWAKNG